MDARREMRRKQHSSERQKHSKGKRERKRRQENIQNSKRSVAKYWNRESRYA